MHHSRSFILAVVVLLWVIPLSALAFYSRPVNSQRGFTHPAALQPDDTLAGKQLNGQRIIRNSPVVADLDGNSANGLELVIGDRGGKLFALNAQGQTLWETQVVNCALFDNDDGVLFGAPSIAELDSSRPGREVVVGYGKVRQDSSCPGGIRAYSSTGEPLWNYQIPISPISGQSGVFSTPSVADVDGTGDIVIVAGSADLYLHVLNKDGSLRWKYFAMDSIWSSAAFADVNGDGRKDILVGTDFTPGRVCDAANIGPDPGTNSRDETARGFLYAFPADPVFTADPIYCARDGGKVIGFGKGFLWSVRFDQSIYASPAVADLDDDGSLEVIVGASCYYANAGRWVKIFDGRTGSEQQTLNAPNCVASSPAVGDITGDGKLEIVAAVASGGSANPPLATPPGGGRLVAWTYANPNPIWSTEVQGATQELADMSEPFNNPLIADIDGNGSHEVVAVVQNSVMIYDGAGQALTPSCPTGGPDADACVKANLQSMFMWMPIRGTPALADIDNDGKLEIVVGGSHTSTSVTASQDKAFLYVWRDLDQVITSAAGRYAPYNAPWPQFQRDAAHGGVLLSRALSTTVTTLHVLTDRSRPQTYKISLSSRDGSPLEVILSENGNTQRLVTANLSSTTITATNPGTLTLKIDAGKAPLGTEVITLTLRSDGVPDVVITVTVRVVNQLWQTFTPLIGR